MKVGIGLNPMGHSHYTDHLAVICIALDIPLLFTDETQFQQAQRLYPDLRCVYHDWNSITPTQIVGSCDILLISDIWSEEEYLERFGAAEKALGKTLRVIHCPHGYSDKDFWLRRCAEEDISLVYGPRMWHMLQADSRKPHAAYVITGNLRYAYYKQHQNFLDAVVREDIFHGFAKKQPTILYAPTWRDRDLSTSFFDVADRMIQQLPEDCNLVVKLHPNLEEEDIASVYQVIAIHEEKPNVRFIRQYPLIYPLLAQCDIFIGDRSAVGYDFLSFNRPMFFLMQTTQNDYLHLCGTQIQPIDFDRIFSIIQTVLPEDSALYCEIRQKVYHEAFGEERTMREVRSEITNACDTPPADSGWARR